MKLTNTLRQAFVRAAMNDVPSVDYTEQIRTLVNAKVKKLLIKAGIQDQHAERLNSQYFSFAHQGFSVRGLTSDEHSQMKLDPELKALGASYEAQRQERNKLETSLTGAIAGCTTRKQAVEALPEFEKYLPADGVAAMRSLPALANVLTDFVKAGWPKNQKRITV